MKEDESKATLEVEVSRTNAGFFFEEFSFSRAVFSPPGGTQRELADHIVALGDRLLVFQLKERKEPEAPGGREPTAEDRAREKRWFDKKVLADATKQIRDTLRYLEDFPVEVENERGRSTRLGRRDSGPQRRTTKIVLYRAGRNLPDDCRAVKHHVSKTAGIIHVVSVDDWISILHTLVTPTEIIEYFDMREELLQLYPDGCKAVPEYALVGQFLLGIKLAQPSAEFSEAVRRYEADYERFDITGILHSLGRKATHGSSPIPGEPLAITGVEQDYYPIIEGLARFGRSDCAVLKERFELCWQRCKGQVPFTSRFVSTSTMIGVLLLAVPRGWEPKMANGLYKLTELHKYDRKLRQCIGIAFSHHGDSDEERFIAWMYIESEWTHDPDLEAELENVPEELLPPLRVAVLPTYTFKE